MRSRRDAPDSASGCRGGLLLLLALAVAFSTPLSAEEPGQASRLAALDHMELLPVTVDAAPAGLELASAWLLDGEVLAAAELLQDVVELASRLDDAETAAGGRALLAATDRLWLRPAAGRARWRTSRIVRPAGIELKKPSGIAARGDGEIIVTDPAIDTVLRCDAQGAVIETWRLPNAGRPVWGERGEILVATKAGITMLADAPGSPPAGAGRPRTWAVDRDADDEARDAAGQRWVLDRKQGLLLLAADGSRLGRLALPDLRKPAALDVDRLGNLYVLDAGGEEVVVLDRTSRVLARVGPVLPGGLELGRPEDIALDDAGRLFIVDRKLGIVVLE